MYSLDVFIYVCLCSLCALQIASCSRNYKDKNLADCFETGLHCSAILSSCKFDLDTNKTICDCIPGIKGITCDEDVDECSRGSPCHKGVCHNSIGSYRCACLPGWRGPHCTISDGSGLSTCDTGYTGTNCTEDFDECTQWRENPCHHNGSCINTPGSFTCNCMTGWGGRICNEPTNDCERLSDNNDNMSLFWMIVGSVGCFVGVIGTGMAIHTICSRKSHRVKMATQLESLRNV